MQWTAEPPRWAATDDGVELTTAPDTDFWRHTHYGFVHDSGHFWHRRVRGDFRASTRIAGRYRDQYDQAGLMIRADAETWVKCGIEFVDGVQRVSAVVTLGRSDWSLAALPEQPASLRVVLARRGDALELGFGEPGAEQPLRVAPFPAVPELDVGVMAASPTGGGFEVRLGELVIEPLTAGST